MIKVKKVAVLLLAMIFMVLAAPAAYASDHLINAATSPGAGVRDFGNPVVGNPADAQAKPGLVPGEGDPKSGGDTTTPAVSCNLLNPKANPPFTDCD